jgi:hypothetical protein
MGGAACGVSGDTDEAANFGFDYHKEKEGGEGGGCVQFVLRRGRGGGAAQGFAEQARLSGGNQALGLELLAEGANLLVGEGGLSGLR